MIEQYNAVLKILHSSISDAPLSLPSDTDWESIYEILGRGKVLGITFRCISALPEEQRPAKELLSIWQRHVFSRGFQQMISNHELSNVLSAAKAKGLTPVVFKGIFLANLYPEPNMRFSSDCDIFIIAQDRQEMEQVLTKMNYIKNEEHSKEHVPVYQNLDKQHMLVVELHDCLWEDYTGHQMDLLDSLKLTAPETLIDASCCNIPVTTLGYTEHLIYQIFHVAKHFAFDSLPLRYLIDLTLFINNFCDKLDLSRFWTAMDMLKYTRFCTSLFTICIKHLGMTQKILPAGYSLGEINESLLIDIMTLGNTFGHAIGHYASTEPIDPFFTRKNKIGTSEFSRVKARFFPTADELKEKYDYAQKCRLLLPIAWIHRFVSAGIFVVDNSIRKRSTTAIWENADYRLRLLQELDMLDEK